MTLNAADLLLILVLIAGGFAATYLLMLRRIARLVNERQLKIADHLGTLNEAIQALETRLAEHHSAAAREALEIAASADADVESAAETGESVAVAPEVKAAIAAAAAAALGQNAVVKSVKPVSSPWSQQGRVLVQGSHNLRVRQ